MILYSVNAVDKCQYILYGWLGIWRLAMVKLQNKLNFRKYSQIMMTSSNGNIFHVTGPFVWGIHRWPVISPHKGQWRGALMFSLICGGMNDWVNNREAGDLRRHRAHHDVTVMCPRSETPCYSCDHKLTWRLTYKLRSLCFIGGITKIPFVNFSISKAMAIRT